MNYTKVYMLILDILLALCFLGLIVAVILWIWCGWYYFWRMELSALISIVGLAIFKNLYAKTILKYEQQNSKKAKA